jgi:TIR domain
VVYLEKTAAKVVVIVFNRHLAHRGDVDCVNFGCGGNGFIWHIGASVLGYVCGVRWEHSIDLVIRKSEVAGQLYSATSISANLSYVAGSNPDSASEPCKVFISYSWDSDAHKAWVLDFANRLRTHGIEVILDQTHLRLGDRTPYFMEQSATSSRFVLVICTEAYKTKFDARKGGAGYESHIITGEIVDQVGVNKFIPILRQGDWRTALPIALSGVLGADFRKDSTDEYQKLVNHLLDLVDANPVGSKTPWPGAAQSRPPVVTPQAYIEQLKKLPDTDVIKKIWQKPHWRIWSRPQEFRKARFKDLDDCARFAANANVRYRSRWTDYPRFPAVLEYQEECVANEVEITEGSIHHWERWLLFRSAQFVHNMALDHVMQLKARHTHILEILDIVTAVYEFIGRMAMDKVFSGQVVMSFEFVGVAGQQLTWPIDYTQDIDGVAPRSWYQEDSFSVHAATSADELIRNRRESALNTAIEIFAHFGWSDPPKEGLAAKQHDRFGQPRGL